MSFPREERSRDGGGVCQVSTTLFRASDTNAGLPAVEREVHAYRVSYYEQDMGPGYDATVFFPSTDLKFVNDTAGHILIQTKVDAKNFSMRYEIYGTMTAESRPFQRRKSIPKVRH